MGFRYIGSKFKIANIILDKISSIVPQGSHVVDLMCGTAAISRELKKNGFQVTATDVMTYACIHAKVFLNISEPLKFEKANKFIKKYLKASDTIPLSNNYENILNALNNVPVRKSYFFKEFSSAGQPKNTEKPRNYFSPYNASKIDAIRYWIKKLHKDKQLNEHEHAVLLNDLIMSVNDVANIAGTYGHHLSRLMGRAKSEILLEPNNIDIKTSNRQHNVICGYAEEIAKEIQCDLCYIDPPYMKRQYAANYHILETIAREDFPEAIGISGLRPWRDQYSNFCTKTKIQNSFNDILNNMRCKHFLISYSEDGLLTLKQLTKLLSEYGKVEVTSFRHKRFKSNNSKLPSYIKEYLFHLVKI